MKIIKKIKDFFNLRARIDDLLTIQIDNVKRIHHLEKRQRIMRVKQDIPVGKTITLIAKVREVRPDGEVSLDLYAPSGGVFTPIIFRAHHMLTED